MLKNIVYSIGGGVVMIIIIFFLLRENVKTVEAMHFFFISCCIIFFLFGYGLAALDMTQGKTKPSPRGYYTTE